MPSVSILFREAKEPIDSGRPYLKSPDKRKGKKEKAKKPKSRKARKNQAQKEGTPREER